MSDLYVVLRNRLDTVAEWVELGTDVMKTARESLGLSYEAVARAIPVSSKTYERYEKRGRVPRPLLFRFAEVLELEVERPERTRVTVDDPGHDSDLRQILGELADVREAVARVEALLEEQRAPRARKRQASP